MTTPIYDYVNKYKNSRTVRMHMPGHKGNGLLGFESFDITEITGADSLFDADGIIRESEENASRLFGSGMTLYGTEGSTQCIKAMLYLAVTYRRTGTERYILAVRNAHKAFLYGCALLDISIKWIYPKSASSLLGAIITPKELDNYLSLSDSIPAAVYITSPDYLGGMSDIKGLSKVCEKHGTLLIVDNAHGAYLHFLKEKKHPLDLGAFMCCDSAHKTLPVLTGGAYLHLSCDCGNEITKHAKSAMALFSSTSPSYLILQSLDLCNKYINEGYSRRLAETVEHINSIKKRLKEKNIAVLPSDPLKITLYSPVNTLAPALQKGGIEYEYHDDNYTVLMITPNNSFDEIERIYEIIGKDEFSFIGDIAEDTPAESKAVMSTKDAMLSPCDYVVAEKAFGRICALPTVSCPPAVPIVMAGEIITQEAVKLFKKYHVESIAVVREKE